MITKDFMKEVAIFAELAHRGQFRKNSDVPFINHPVKVMNVLKDVGAPVEVLAAGLLHDVVEDTEYTLEDIANRFGNPVSELVYYVTEKKEEDGVMRPWKDRKRDYIDLLYSAPYEAVLVSAADKLANLSDTYEDYKMFGDDAFKKFNATKSGQTWYYAEMVALFEKSEIPEMIVDTLKFMLKDMDMEV